MKIVRVALPLAFLLLPLVAAPAASAASVVQASGTSTTTAFSETPVQTTDGVSIFTLHTVATLSGTLNGTTVSDDTCVEQLSTAVAVCHGTDTFSGIVARRAGTIVFADAFTINLQTGATEAITPVVGGTMNVHGVLKSSGNAFAPLPYSGQLVLL